jgi:hypothetical protein
MTLVYLSPDAVPSRQTFIAEPQTLNPIARLALLLHLDREELFTQLIDHRPIARRILVSESTTNFEAWKAAVQRTQRSSYGREKHPATTLTELLVAY